MVATGSPPAAAAAGGTTGGGATGGTTGGGASGGIAGEIGGGAKGGGTTGGTTGGAMGGGIGPGSAIGTPDISDTAAHGAAAAGTSPAEVWMQSDPPACATAGLNPMVIPHSPAPTAATLIPSRSKTAINHQLFLDNDVLLRSGRAEPLLNQA